MRPDEHKRKKNAAYKKKHGINAKAPENSIDKKSKSQDEKKKTTDVSQNRKAANNKATAQVSTDSSSGSEDEIVERRNYKRREVVSNWKKYDLDPDMETAVKSRGEDFSKLLNMGGEAMSHFKFKEELEWEGDIQSGQGDTTEQNDIANDFLALDLADITSSMLCIPVHQLLGIDQGLFPAEQLESQMKFVSENQSCYLNSVGNNFLPESREVGRETKTLKISNERKGDSNKTTTVKRFTHENSSIQQTKELGNCKIDDHPKLAEVAIRSEVQRNSVKAAQTSPIKFSATQSIPDTQTSPVKVSASQSIPQRTPGPQECELDELLEIDARQGVAVQDSGKLPQRSTFSPPKKDDEKEAAELEDWLDSILD